MDIDNINIKPNDDNTFTVCVCSNSDDGYEEKRYTANSISDITSVIEKAMSEKPTSKPKKKMNDMDKLMGKDFMEEEDD